MSYFITFEGGEGSGKTTIISAVYEYLVNKGHNAIVTRDPGGTKISEEIRKIILDKENHLMDAKTEALLFAASRTQLIAEVIIPALNEKKIILCDRFLDSSIAYQGFARNVGIENILNINLFILKYMPHMTFFIDARPEICLKRLKDNHRETDRLDDEEMTFHQKVYEGYQEIIRIDKSRIIRIDGERDQIEIINDVISYIDKLLEIKNV